MTFRIKLHFYFKFPATHSVTSRRVILRSEQVIASTVRSDLLREHWSAALQASAFARMIVEQVQSNKLDHFVICYINFLAHVCLSFCSSLVVECFDLLTFVKSCNKCLQKCEIFSSPIFSKMIEEYYYFTCNFCEYTTKDFSELKTHVNSIHFPENSNVPQNVSRHVPAPDSRNKSSSILREPGIITFVSLGFVNK
jgi:hypothetical protein